MKELADNEEKEIVKTYDPSEDNKNKKYEINTCNSISEEVLPSQAKSKAVIWKKK